MSLENAVLPLEILELILDEIKRSRQYNEKEVQETLQTCSFVCYAFRSRASRHLFSTLQLIQHPFSSPSKLLTKLWDLRELVHAGHQLGLPSILHYTRSFQLVMDGSLFDAYAILENEDLARIMRILCKYSSVLHTIAIAGSFIPIFWPDLSREFQEAFRDLTRVPTVTTLRLNNISGVPANILHGTNIDHVKFHLVKSFYPMLAHWPFFCVFHTDQLRGLDIDYTFPIAQPSNVEPVEELDPLFSQVGSSFSGVKSLQYTFYHPEDFQRLMNIASSLPSLESVVINYSNSTSSLFEGLGYDVPFDTLSSLRTLGICHKSDIAVGIRSPLLKVADLLTCIDVPPSLETLILGFVVRTTPPWLRLAEYFPEPKTWGLLDKLLVSERYSSVRSVQLRLQYVTLPGKPWSFDEDVFLRRCRACLQDVFPLVMSCKTKTLEVDVAVFPLGRNVDILDFGI
ncbi:hypothetical protein CPC08DRAFT_480432 [Agrocybe pediades]|nr:hypothetical protein CPC08DRAFT_480432 [Agrocybe pediades]